MPSGCCWPTAFSMSPWWSRHEDHPPETIWFERVADVARDCGLPVTTPTDPNAAATLAQVRALAPDFVFAFYYRKMLSPDLLACARRGALNMHGSLLPRYRGRAPVNWAVRARQAREDGRNIASLHGGEARCRRPHVAQMAVPIPLPDDTRARGLCQGDRGGRDHARSRPARLARRHRTARSARSRAGIVFRRTHPRGRPHRLAKCLPARRSHDPRARRGLALTVAPLPGALSPTFADIDRRLCAVAAPRA